MNGWIEEGRKKGREEGKKTGNDVGKERGRRESEGTDGWCNSEKTICCLPFLDLLLEESIDPIPLAMQLLLISGVSPCPYTGAQTDQRGCYRCC